MEFSLLSDEPVTGPDLDLLGTGRAARELAKLVHDSRTATPFTLAVDAGWGMGKSSLMRLVEAELLKRRDVETVWYNAWTSTGADALEGLIKSVLMRFDRRVLRRAMHRVSERRDPDQGGARDADPRLGAVRRGGARGPVLAGHVRQRELPQRDAGRAARPGHRAGRARAAAAARRLRRRPRPLLGGDRPRGVRGGEGLSGSAGAGLRDRLRPVGARAVGDCCGPGSCRVGVHGEGVPDELPAAGAGGRRRARRTSATAPSAPVCASCWTTTR